MPAIPVVNISIPLSDTGYKFRFTEADTSTTLGQFGFANPQAQPIGEGGVNQSYAGAFFPGYNTLGSPMTPTPENFQLHAHTKTGFGVSGVLPAFNLWGFDGTNFLQINWDSTIPSIQAKITAWPAAIDYSTAGMVTLTITNPPSANGMAPGGISAVTFQDGTHGFVLWSQNDRGVGPTPELLPIRLNLALAGTWVADPREFIDGQPTASFPLAGINYMATLANAPTLDIYEVVYDVSGASMLVTETVTASGDISTNAQNAFLPSTAQGSGDSGFYYTPIGIFGIDYNSGNDTGCWYCRYDCTAYGNVTFPMPDASIGPSSSQTAYWVWNFFNNLSPAAAATVFQFYPNWDPAGNVWWIRVPLQAGGNYVLEGLTGEVYTTLSGPGATPQILGTHVGFVTQGHFGGGTK